MDDEGLNPMVNARKPATTAKTTTPRAKTAPTAAEALDDLIPTAGGPSAPSVDDTEGEEQTESHDNSDSVSFEQAELEALRAQLAEARAQLEAAPKEAYKPVDESTLTPEQRQIRELQDQLAKTKGSSDSVVQEYFENVEGGILVHFLEDGLTSNGRNFLRGQEVTFGPEAYADTIDRFGQSWINLTDEQQMARWGKVKFRKGPWPGVRKYSEPELAGKSITFQAPAIRI